MRTARTLILRLLLDSDDHTALRGALRLYRDLERTLREELGIAPQQELRQLFESLRQL